MSLNLDSSEGGVWIKTSSQWAATKEGPFHTFMLGADKKGTRQCPLHEATDEIYELAHTDEASDDPVMNSISAYIGELDILPHPEYQYDNGERRRQVIPSHRAKIALQRARAAASQEKKPVAFMGVDIDGKDFVELVDYVMTNTLLHPEEWDGQGEDPRVAMIEGFRGAA